MGAVFNHNNGIFQPWVQSSVTTGCNKISLFSTWWTLKTFPEWWYCTVMVGHTATLSYSPSK
jgi:hypothetical protein